MLRTKTFLIAGLGFALAACSPPQAAPPETPATTTVATNAAVIVTAPVSGARVSSPIVVEGTAPGDWFFEAQFPVKLVAADGTVLAERLRAQSDWMTEAPVPYRAELVFVATQETQATLVLQEDMPADNTSPREVSVPVVLAP